MQHTLGWPHFLFLVPLGFGVCLMLASLLGAVGGDFDVDLDADVDVDVDAEMDAEAEAHGAGHGLFEFLGFGRAPMSVILLSFSLLFGGLGLATLFTVEPWLSRIGFVPALSVAAIGSLWLTRRVALAVARWMPGTETYASSPEELVGLEGTAELAITPRFGVVNVNAADGSLLKVRCVTSKETIAKGARVLLVEFNSDERTYLVAPSPLGNEIAPVSLSVEAR